MCAKLRLVIIVSLGSLVLNTSLSFASVAAFAEGKV